MNDPNITNFIVETVLNNPFILGSQLGTKVKQRFPSFEKLKTYIDRYCVGQIICVRMHGPDFVYAHISQIERKAQSDSPAGEAVTALSQPESFSRPPFPSPVTVGESVGYIQPSRTLRKVTVWSAFTNPVIDERLAIDPAIMELQVIPRHGLIQLPIKEIPKVTPEEHHKIASDFLPQIEIQDRPQFQQTPGNAIIWSSWSWQIKQFEGGKYFNLWLDFRTKTLRNLLAERLAKLGLNGTISEPLLDELLESKQQRKSRIETIADFGGPPSARNPNSLTESELRRIATIAISEMSADELRRLCFPLGAIVNALPKNAS